MTHIHVSQGDRFLDSHVCVSQEIGSPFVELNKAKKYGIIDSMKGGGEMEETMTLQEQIINEINQFSMLWRIKNDMPEGVENRQLENELKLSEIRLHTLGVNTEDLKV